jgi:hypothetical protein
MFDDHGERVWSDLEKGHMDMGWVARLGTIGGKTAMAIRIGGKTAGPQGFARRDVEEFVYDAFTGKKQQLRFSVFGTMPADLNGDGLHELVRGLAGGDGCVLDGTGRVVGKVEGTAELASRFMDRPGEQLVTYARDGTIRIWADLNARDTEAARWRYQHRFYLANQRLTASGYNRHNLGGL